jgi:hypothetical protein
MSEPSWNDLNPQPQQPPRDNHFDEICMRVFTAADGRELLAMLRRRYFDTGGNDLADDRALRVRIAKQQFVRELELACERSLKANAKPK